MNKIAIIGTGISGLTCAHYLKELADITLFEKSRGVGGRISTRRADPFCFDHGAQYFTAQSKEFKTFIKPLLKQEIIVPWHSRFVAFQKYNVAKRLSTSIDDKYYIGVPSMSSIGKYLVDGLDIRLSTHISNVDLNRNRWTLTTKSGERHDGFDWVIVTAPAPQTIELMPSVFKFYDELDDYEMTSCVSLMLGFEKPLNLSFDCAKITDSDIEWISVNSNKPGRNDHYSLLVQASTHWVDQHLNDGREAILKHLSKETSLTIEKDLSKAVHKDIHIWRFSRGYNQQKSHILVDKKSKLAACGDWCVGSDVESAFTSAFNVSRVIKEFLLNE